MIRNICLLFFLFPALIFSQIQINELFADNGDCCLDDALETEDFVEIINLGSAPVDISGYYFGDQDGGSVIPSGYAEETTISSGGLLVIWFDQDLDQGPLHVDAKLNNDGENLIIIDSSGQTIVDILFGEQSEDISFAAFPDGQPYSDGWEFSMCPSPGDPNESCPLVNGCTSSNAFNYNALASVEDGSCLFTVNQGLVINEYSASNCNADGGNCGDYEDWIELYNNSAEPIDLEGYYLSDKIDNLLKWQFPSSVTINPMSYMVIYASGLDPELEVSNNNTSFKLTQTKNNEFIILSNPDGDIIDYVQLDRHQLNHSIGRESNQTGWSVFLSSTPGAVNGSTPYNGYTATPTFNNEPGFYNSSLNLSLVCDSPNTDIYYSLDGSFPDVNSIYYGSTDDQGTLSPFIPPINITSTTVIRVIAISQDGNYLPSFVETNTYFINNPHTVKVVSISGDQVEDLLNGNQIRPVGSVEVFDESGALLDEAVGEFNKHGNDSWYYDQRGLDYIIRDQYGYNYGIQDKLFTTKDRDSFQRLILKAAANDNYPFTWGNPAHIRDSYVHSLSQIGDLRMDERSHESCVLYVNGEYWGVYDIREKVDDLDFTDYYYDQPKGYVEFIKTWGATWVEFGGYPEVLDTWNTLKDFIINNDMSDSENYDYVKSVYNTGSLIDYFILNSYVVCMDWLNWNTGWWRGTHPNGDKKKWRYILWDMDATFGHYTNYTGIPDTSADADPCNPETLGDPGGQGHVPILNSLFENEEFTSDYINRYADLSNTIFSCDFMISHLDSLVNIITPEMPQQIQRWGGSYQEWEENVQILRDYILERCSDEFIEGMEECYDVEALDVTIIIEGGGEVEINSIDLDPNTSPWTGVYYSGLPISLSASGSNDVLFNFYWEVVDGDLVLDDPTNPDIIFNLDSPITIIAHFDACLSIETEEIVGPTIVEQGSIWQYTFPSQFTNTSEWSVEGGDILFTSSSENTIAIQWNYGTGEGQIILNQYNSEGLLECLFVNIEIVDDAISAVDNSYLGNEGLFAFPNPAKDILNIVFSLEDLDALEIYSLNGKIVFFDDELDQKHIHAINVTHLSPGVYLLVARGNSRQFLQKISIQ